MPVNTSGVSLFSGIPPLTEAQTTGRVFFVGNSTTYVPAGVAGVDSGAYGDTPARPFATWDFAVGQCTAGRGDTIYVLPGHAETVAGTIAVDVASIRTIGLGVGGNRPTLTFDTTTDVVAVSAANCEVANLVFVCNVASHTRFIDLQGGADGAWIHHCLLREGTATGLSMIEWTGAADDVVIEHNLFYAPTAGNYDEAILIASTPTRGVIRQNFIFGDFDEGGINNAVANIATLFLIHDNDITNLLAGAEAIDLDSAVTGMISNNRLSTDAIGTAIDQGSMRCNGNLWSSTTDGTSGVPIPATPADTTTADTVLGALFGTGGIATWPAAAAYANAVSIAEVLAYIQDGTRRGTGTTLAANESLADVLYAANGIVTFPAAAIPANGVSMAEVLRQIYAALEGTAASQDGVATWPTAAAYANGVSIAEVLGYIQDGTRRGTGTTLAANESLADVLYAPNGIVTFPASAAPANGVSIAEVLRELYDQSEKAVTNTTAALVNATTIFTITGGPIEVLSLVARCATGNDATASTLQWSADPTDGAAATFSGASASLASALAGATVVLQGTTLATAPVVNTSGVGLGQGTTSGIVVGAGIITTTVGVGSTTGTWQHHLRYRPLSRGVSVS